MFSCTYVNMLVRAVCVQRQHVHSHVICTVHVSCFLLHSHVSNQDVSLYAGQVERKRFSCFMFVLHGADGQLWWSAGAKLPDGPCSSEVVYHHCAQHVKKVLMACGAVMA